MIFILDRNTAANLYLNLLVPWETVYRDIPEKGGFDIRSKEFTAYKRDNKFEIKPLNTKSESDKEINENLSFGSEARQLAIFQIGNNSRARSLFKHLRNSVAHAHVERLKIKNKWFLIFSAKSDDKYVLKAQIQESKLRDFIAALKSTAKNI
ncbi:HEPN family nuclease [Nitrosomonas sp. Is35]|uniref:HEPN family nuclease n=1 Tax=Nitrosomonas sp. Is35 TaxID=3080534 RepID=UPI00294B1885|nr:HEPN family nuclease [Nitrosomonas sp. Is35]MDV6346293.1 HEPN family nuclease [Nitrosomonas sp. Is35]